MPWWLLLIAGLLALPLSAQNAGVNSPPLVDVVVTARRVATPRLEAAPSITRLEPGAQGHLDLTHHAEILARSPGTYVQRGSGQESLIALRSPVLAGAGACGAFLFLEDGFPLRPTGFCNINELFEVNTSQAAAIEVIRGPGTVVHGANAVHGVINVLSPSPASLAGQRLGIIVGPDGYLDGRLSLGTHSSAVYGLWRRDEGFRVDSAVREWKLNFAHERELANGTLTLRAAHTSLDQDTAGFIRGFAAYRDPVLRRSNPNPEAFRDARSLRASAAWQRQDCDRCNDEWRILLRDSHMRFRQHFLLGKPLESNGQRSIALASSRARPFTSADAWRWRIGADAEWGNGTLLQWQEGPTLEGSEIARAIRPAGRHYDYDLQLASLGIAASIDGEWRRWRIEGSLRLDRTRYDYDNRLPTGNAAEDGRPCEFGGCLYLRPADRIDQFDNATPRLEVSYRLASSQRLFFIASDGFRPPETTEIYRLQRGQSPDALDSERLRSAELGWRVQLPHAELALSAFEARKRRLILREANGLIVIGGRTRHTGLEYEGRWSIHDTVALRWAGSWARHRYEFTRNVEGGESIVAGRDIDTAPRTLNRLTLAWDPTPRLRTELDWQQVGAYFADAANERRYPGHDVLSVRAAWQTGTAWRVTLDIDNLTDRRYADRADFAQGDWRYFPARGRSFFLGLDWRRPETARSAED